MKDKYRKFVLLGLVALVGAGTIYTYIAGENQDKRYIEDFQQYQVALGEMQEDQIGNAKEKMLHLHNKYHDQANITRNLGLIYAMEGDFEKAALYYQKAVDQMPFIVQDPLFSLQFGEMLFYKGELGISQQYIEHGKAVGLPDEYVQRADELLAQIETEQQR
ncbi:MULTISPECIES: tetratricopeptide repeat protein [Bacillaceae]|uniref:tetratricopeptide repeat protein n=1 Tax=Bacillaceae TaxID=186817 RepID=UPI002964AD32|nr:tetratricopeptide repeat protein [Bacillus infantis]MDW2876415.1 hypothetical protein [Bacillus infantis]